MKRPVDQAKLVFFGLLRTVSALATEHHPPKSMISSFLAHGRSSFIGGSAAAAVTASPAVAATKATATTTSGSSSEAAATSTMKTTTTTPSMSMGGTGPFSVYGAHLGVRSRSTSEQNSNTISNNNNNNHNANGEVITLRLAKRTDVSGIQRCNLATLPENYNQQFYINHLRQWPELAIVAECQQTGGTTTNNNNGNGMRSLAYSPFPTHHHASNSNSGNSGSNIVAYVIGKVEEQTVYMDQEAELQRQQDNGGYYTSGFQELPSRQQQQQQQHQHYTVERMGHVTSLAVSEPYRRLGLAQDLMKQLHHHMSTCYVDGNNNNNNNNNGVTGSVDTVGLHVRQSNLPAAALYEKFGYQVTERIPNYYQDGEDAYLMTKNLQEDQNLLADQQRQQQQSYNKNNNNNSGRAAFQSVFGRFGAASSTPPRPWERNFNGPMDLQLPRVVGNPQQQQAPSDTASTTSSSSTTSTTATHPELLTGTM